MSKVKMSLSFGLRKEENKNVCSILLRKPLLKKVECSKPKIKWEDKIKIAHMGVSYDDWGEQYRTRKYSLKCILYKHII
jgi:hypothetical protein